MNETTLNNMTIDELLAIRYQLSRNALQLLVDKLVDKNEELLNKNEELKKVRPDDDLLIALEEIRVLAEAQLK